MFAFEHIHRLHRILSTSCTPRDARDLIDTLECSHKSLQRYIRHLRDHLGAPIEYVRQPLPGYRFRPGERHELPGLWLSEAELLALLSIQQMLEQVGPELLSDVFRPIEARLRKLVDGQSSSNQLSSRIRALGQHHAFAPPPLPGAAGALSRQLVPARVVPSAPRLAPLRSRPH